MLVRAVAANAGEGAERLYCPLASAVAGRVKARERAASARLARWPLFCLLRMRPRDASVPDLTFQGVANVGFGKGGGMYVRFRDRSEAGRALAGRLQEYAGRPDVIVLGLPRGGVPVAYEVARALGVPLDIFGVRKLGVPGQEELAMGAVASGGVRVINDEVVGGLAIDRLELNAVTSRELAELKRREQKYRAGRALPELAGRTVIVVDDGLTTKSTMRAAVQALRQHGPARIVVAVPVGANQTCQRLQAEADEVVCPLSPEVFFAVGAWYEDFSQTSDAEVSALLERARHEQEAPVP